MKYSSPNQAVQSAVGMNAPPEQTKYGIKPAVDVDEVIEEIHLRAEYVGSVLEEILQTGHESFNWCELV